MTGTNSYGGVTTISNGGLVFGTASALPTTLTSNAITLNGGYVGVAGYSVNALLNSGLITASPASGGIALTAADSENINFATAGTGTYRKLGLAPLAPTSIAARSRPRTTSTASAAAAARSSWPMA